MVLSKVTGAVGGYLEQDQDTVSGILVSFSHFTHSQSTGFLVCSMTDEATAWVSLSISQLLIRGRQEIETSL